MTLTLRQIDRFCAPQQGVGTAAAPRGPCRQTGGTAWPAKAQPEKEQIVPNLGVTKMFKAGATGLRNMPSAARTPQIAPGICRGGLER